MMILCNLGKFLIDAVKLIEVLLSKLVHKNIQVASNANKYIVELNVVDMDSFPLFWLTKSKLPIYQ